MKRRDFIGIAAVGATGLVCPVAVRGERLDSVLANPRLLDILHDGRVVQELGRRYREIVPTEDDPRMLAMAILSEERASDEADLRTQLDEQVQRDFADGRTVVLNGWILSLTEARQCALHSLRFS